MDFADRAQPRDCTAEELCDYLAATMASVVGLCLDAAAKHGGMMQVDSVDDVRLAASMTRLAQERTPLEAVAYVLADLSMMQKRIQAAEEQWVRGGGRPGEVKFDLSFTEDELGGFELLIYGPRQQNPS